MKHIYIFVVAFLCCTIGLFAQSSRLKSENYSPKLIMPFNVISAFENAENRELNLNSYFDDPGNSDAVVYEILSNSNDFVATAIISRDSILVIDFLKAGQTNIIIKATSNDQSITEKMVVGVQPRIEGDYVISDFENFELEPNTFWNGSDGADGFVSGVAQFQNDNSGWGWTGWAFSNMSDVKTAGYENQYSAITGAGFNSSSNGMNYGIGYVSSDWNTNQPIPLPVLFSDKRSHLVQGLYITNSTYAALSMEHGDSFAKKFGGEDGNDPDYLKIFVWGVKNGLETDTIEYYLADYRFEDNSKDYIIKTWQWLELSSLGEIDSLLFSIASSDVGDYGINTPTYFNIDNIYLVRNTTQVETVNNSLSIKVYPNPTSDKLWIESPAAEELNVRIYNLSGSLVYNNPNHFSRNAINLSEFSNGTYILKIGTLSENNVVKIIKR